MPKGVYPRTKEHNRKISIFQKNRKRMPHSEETKRKIGISNTGKVRTNECNQHQHLLRIGKSWEESLGVEGAKLRRQKQTKALTGHPVSTKTRMKIGKGNKGKVRTEEIKLQWSISHTGKKLGPRPEEYKKRTSEIHTRLIAEGKITLSGRGINGYYQSKENGKVRYRSSYELAVMKYFDKNNTKWIYEGKKNKFYLQPINRHYLNDFYLPKEDKYIQVKGYMSPEDKFHVFKTEYSHLNIELWDTNVLKERGII